MRKLRDMLITSAILAAFVLGWVGGPNFASSGFDACAVSGGLTSNASPSALDAGKENVLSALETGRPVTWEAATVVGLRLRANGDTGCAVANNP